MGNPIDQQPFQQPQPGPMQQTVLVQQQPSNGLGMAGFICSLVSLVSCGILFPIGLILSFIGVFFEPRGFAIAGLVISIGSAVLVVVCYFLFLGALLWGTSQVLEVGNEIVSEMKERQEIRDFAEAKLDQFCKEQKRLPNHVEFKEIMGEESEKFRLQTTSATKGIVIHWGEDKRHDTIDDIRFKFTYTEGLGVDMEF